MYTFLIFFFVFEDEPANIVSQHCHHVVNLTENRQRNNSFKTAGTLKLSIQGVNESESQVQGHPHPPK